MNKTATVTILTAIAAVVIPYLLTQSDVAIPPIVKVLLTAGNLALVVVARFSNPSGEAQAVMITEPVQIIPPPGPTIPPTNTGTPAGGN